MRWVMKEDSGFTIIELLIIVAIMAVVTALAVPALGQFILNRSINSQANTFSNMLTFARSEAIKRNSRVSVCKSANGATCTAPGDWAQGFIVFVDPVNQGVVDAGEAVLRVVGRVHDSLTMVGVPQGPAGPGTVSDVVTYRSDGLSAQSGRWTVCSNTGNSNFAVRINMALGSGRITIDRSSNNQWCLNP
jgi:type IV fimbrial biogenesis protein FimT